MVMSMLGQDQVKFRTRLSQGSSRSGLFRDKFRSRSGQSRLVSAQSQVKLRSKSRSRYSVHHVTKRVRSWSGQGQFQGTTKSCQGKIKVRLMSRSGRCLDKMK